ncbi:hypothetical protein BJ508DRAFT_350480 [Ascobolus immersus RN42]|uniref:Uncharacterized protein n=1 Tax=Ascobolus immersus RN42 TaxID=1160509 RepID=A0A3N4I074_ASCIM|nr:hypothetical protein BJ508DRAFT_350480 [Ascobolus immersus RN42]
MSGRRYSNRPRSSGSSSQPPSSYSGYRSIPATSVGSSSYYPTSTSTSGPSQPVLPAQYYESSQELHSRGLLDYGAGGRGAAYAGYGGETNASDFNTSPYYTENPYNNFGDMTGLASFTRDDRISFGESNPVPLAVGYPRPQRTRAAQPDAPAAAVNANYGPASTGDPAGYPWEYSQEASDHNMYRRRLRSNGEYAYEVLDRTGGGYKAC